MPNVKSRRKNNSLIYFKLSCFIYCKCTYRKKKKILAKFHKKFLIVKIIYKK